MAMSLVAPCSPVPVLSPERRLGGKAERRRRVPGGGAREPIAELLSRGGREDAICDE